MYNRCPTGLRGCEVKAVRRVISDVGLFLDANPSGKWKVPGQKRVWSILSLNAPVQNKRGRP
jgi:hypothetical protein